MDEHVSAAQTPALKGSRCMKIKVCLKAGDSAHNLWTCSITSHSVYCVLVLYCRFTRWTILSKKLLIFPRSLSVRRNPAETEDASVGIVLFTSGLFPQIRSS